MNNTAWKRITFLLLAALLLAGAGVFLFGQDTHLEKEDLIQPPVPAPSSPPSPPSSICTPRDGSTLGVISLYYILFSSMAKENRSALTSSLPPQQPTEPRSPRPLPRPDP